MKLRIPAITAIVTALAFVPTPALAKGPTEVALTGPGLDGPIRFEQSGNWERTGGALISAAGLFDAFGYPARLALLPDAPTRALGSRYVAVYREIYPEGVEGLEVRQELYPFAEGGPLVYTPSGQSLYGTQTGDGGWKRADPRLTEILVSVGVPSPGALEERQDRHVASASDDARVVPLGPGASVAIILALASGALLGGVLLRRVRRARPS